MTEEQKRLLAKFWAKQIRKEAIKRLKERGEL